MCKHYWLSFLLLFTFKPVHAIQFQCSRLDSGTSAKIIFNSQEPSLTEAVGGASALLLLDAKEACGQALDCKSNCIGNLIEQEGEYNYNFRCDAVFGDLYFTAKNGGAAQFRCFGEQVPGEYGDRIYRGCKVKP